jgi:hypothetical protein
MDPQHVAVHAVDASSIFVCFPFRVGRSVARFDGFGPLRSTSVHFGPVLDRI